MSSGPAAGSGPPCALALVEIKGRGKRAARAATSPFSGLRASQPGNGSAGVPKLIPLASPGLMRLRHVGPRPTRKALLAIFRCVSGPPTARKGVSGDRRGRGQRGREMAARSTMKRDERRVVAVRRTSGCILQPGQALAGPGRELFAPPLVDQRRPRRSGLGPPARLLGTPSLGHRHGPAAKVAPPARPSSAAAKESPDQRANRARGPVGRGRASRNRPSTDHRDVSVANPPCSKTGNVSSSSGRWRAPFFHHPRGHGSAAGSGDGSPGPGTALFFEISPRILERPPPDSSPTDLVGRRTHSFLNFRRENGPSVDHRWPTRRNADDLAQVWRSQGTFGMGRARRSRRCSFVQGGPVVVEVASITPACTSPSSSRRRRWKSDQEKVSGHLALFACGCPDLGTVITWRNGSRFAVSTSGPTWAADGKRARVGDACGTGPGSTGRRAGAPKAKIAKADHGGQPVVPWVGWPFRERARKPGGFVVG